ncbi:MAG: ComF family protein [Anaerolineae bacterium]
MADWWVEQQVSVDVIIPVPLHPRRLRERGYNQAGLLARALGRRIDVPVWERAIERVRYTRSQMRLDAAARRRNVQRAFHCPDGRVGERKILLIDDVCTTGATLGACAEALHRAGATGVQALTLARAP